MAVDIPNYRVVEKLGVGAQTRVFRARCMRTGKDYAVKYVKLVNPEDAGFIELLKAEYAIGSVIDHPIIRKVFELRMLRRRLRIHGAILFMEYVEGVPLSDKDFQRPLDEVLRIFTEVAMGLKAMHDAGFVHADLKPNNILVTSDDDVKLIDLGQSAKINRAKPRVQGTIDYMAPEQVRREKLDQRTDVFGLGACLHKMLTGSPIKTKMNQNLSVSSQGLVGKRVDGGNESTLQELPRAVVRLIEDCCQPDPAHRIADMPTLAERFTLARMTLKKRPEVELADSDDTPSGMWRDKDGNPIDLDRSDVLPDASEYLDLSDEQKG